MARVARRDTAPEIELRRELHRRGLRYRVDTSPVPGFRGRADLVFGPSRVAVFVDGCFWHQCPQHGNLPKANRDWWREKFDATERRDRRNDNQLEAAGWAVVRVWEHERAEEAAGAVEALVSERRP